MNTFIKYLHNYVKIIFVKIRNWELFTHLKLALKPWNF